METKHHIVKQQRPEEKELSGRFNISAADITMACHGKHGLCCTLLAYTCKGHSKQVTPEAPSTTVTDATSHLPALSRQEAWLKYQATRECNVIE